MKSILTICVAFLFCANCPCVPKPKEGLPNANFSEATVKKSLAKWAPNCGSNKRGKNVVAS